MFVVSKSKGFVLVVAFLLLMGFGLCQAKSKQNAIPTSKLENIKFVTLSQEIYGAPSIYESEEQALFVISASDQMHEFSSWITETARSSLENLDYQKRLGIIVFLGRRDSSGYNVGIKSITQRGNDLFIQIKEEVPRPEISKSAIPTSPYHLISVDKGSLLSNHVTFHLILDDKEILSKTYDLQ